VKKRRNLISVAQVDEAVVRFTKRVVAQGHVTLPSDLRAALDIAAGDLVEFEVLGVVRRSARAAPDGAGALTPAPVPSSIPSAN
jgi:hypothetical protein